MWFARQINDKITCGSKLARNYSLSAKRLYNYAEMDWSDSTMHNKAGRPYALDEESISDLINFANNRQEHPNESMKSKIREEFKKSYGRKFPYIDQNITSIKLSRGDKKLI